MQSNNALEYHNIFKQLFGTLTYYDIYMCAIVE